MKKFKIRVQMSEGKKLLRGVDKVEVVKAPHETAALLDTQKKYSALYPHLRSISMTVIDTIEGGEDD